MLTTIQIFLKVVDTGSFTKTAAILNMAPSSIARAINTLENELQVSLFERSTRYLKLTEKGQIFLEGATKLTNDYAHLRFAISDNKQKPEGKLKLSVFESFGRLHVCPILPKFLARYPDIEVDIELENKVVDLYTDDIDISIRVGVLADSQLKARVLIPNDTLVCATPTYLAKHGTLDDPNQLQFHNCLLLNRGRQQSYWHFKKERQTRTVLVKGNLKSKGGTPLLSAVLNHCGITQLSNWMIADYVKRGELSVLFSDWQSNLTEHSSGNVYALYKPSSFPNPLVRLFIDFLIEKSQNKILARNKGGY